MLDLSKRQQRLYPIKWVDGEVIKLKFPSQADLNFMSAIITKEANEVSDEEALDFLYELLHRIFNNNVSKRKFSKKLIRDTLDFDTALIVISDFTNYLYGILGEYQSPVCQEEQGKNSSLIS